MSVIQLWRRRARWYPALMSLLSMALVFLGAPSASTASSESTGFIGAKVTHTASDPKTYWTQERIKQALKNRMLPDELPSESSQRFLKRSGITSATLR